MVRPFGDSFVHRLMSWTAGSVLLIALAGCTRQDEIRRYEETAVPESDSSPSSSTAKTASNPHGSSPTMPPHAAGNPAAKMRGMRPVAPAPEGWTELPSEGMRKASFLVQDGDRKVEISAIDLPPSGASMLPNINRWRQQLHLEPISDDELATNLEAIRVGGVQGAYVELLGPEEPAPRQAILGAVVLRKGVAWFFKLSGDAELALREKQHFRDYLSSVEFVMGDTSSGNALTQQTPPAAKPETKPIPTLQYETPPGWSPGETSGMRKAAFTVADGEQSVEITAIDLMAAAGNVLDNVNRWRQQVKLDPVTQETLQVTPVQIAGQEAQYVELIGPEDAQPRQAILAAMFVRGDQAWFFKLIGDADLALKEKEHFEAFVKSVSFADGDETSHDK